MYYLMPWPLALSLMAISTGVFLLVDFLRLRLNPVKAIFIILFGSQLRRKEYTGLTGGSYLTLAALVCMLIFGTEPAFSVFGVSTEGGRGVFVAAVSFLILGDTAAAIVGMSLGRIRIFRKTLEGTLAGLITCLGVAYVVSVLPNLDLPFGIGILGAVAASVVEVLPIDVNDNVVIPLLSGGVMMVALQFIR